MLDEKRFLVCAPLSLHTIFGSFRTEDYVEVNGHIYWVVYILRTFSISELNERAGLKRLYTYASVDGDDDGTLLVSNIIGHPGQFF